MDCFLILLLKTKVLFPKSLPVNADISSTHNLAEDAASGLLAAIYFSCKFPCSSLEVVVPVVSSGLIVSDKEEARDKTKLSIFDIMFSIRVM